MKSMLEWLKENSLSLTMFCLFVAFLYGDSATGWHSFNQQQASQSLPQLGYWQYLGTGAFIDGLFVNWQAAALQLTSLIVFSEFMSQRGASHSRKPEEERRQGGSPDEKSADCPSARSRRRAERAGWQSSWLYRNSLSLVFILLFCGAFAVHIVFGTNSYNERRALRHQPPVSTLEYFTSSKMWTETFQTWEAEFFMLWFFLIASIYLRQEYSSESKALGAGIKDTGDPQE